MGSCDLYGLCVLLLHHCRHALAMALRQTTCDIVFHADSAPEVFVVCIPLLLVIKVCVLFSLGSYLWVRTAGC